MVIPKVIVQTSLAKPPEYVVRMIKQLSEGWKYKHFNDEQVIEFFDKNPLPEFPDMKEKFYSFEHGEHRADLFRYYYLYVKGGVYFDTDAMIEVNIDEIVGDNDYISVYSGYYPGTIFQGLIGCVPKCDIVYKALCDMYNMDMEKLKDDFMLICRNMFEFVKENTKGYKLKIFDEEVTTTEYASIFDENKRLILVHYYFNKIIPPR